MIMLNKYLIVIGAFTTEQKAVQYARKLEKDCHPSFILKNGEDEFVGVDKPEKTVKELYDEVMKLGLNGQERKDFLGDRYEEVQNYINNKHK